MSPCTVQVANISSQVAVDHVVRIFTAYAGLAQSIRLSTSASTMEIQFTSMPAASRALEMDGYVVGGKALLVTLISVGSLSVNTTPGMPSTSSSIRVENLPTWIFTDRSDLNPLFYPYGKVLKMEIFLPVTSASTFIDMSDRTIVVVQFAKTSCAEEALEALSTHIYGDDGPLVCEYVHEGGSYASLGLESPVGKVVTPFTKCTSAATRISPWTEASERFMHCTEPHIYRKHDINSFQPNKAYPGSGRKRSASLFTSSSNNYRPYAYA